MVNGVADSLESRRAETERDRVGRVVRRWSWLESLEGYREGLRAWVFSSRGIEANSNNGQSRGCQARQV